MFGYVLEVLLEEIDKHFVNFVSILYELNRLECRVVRPIEILTSLTNIFLHSYPSNLIENLIDNKRIM